MTPVVKSGTMNYLDLSEELQANLTPLEDLPNDVPTFFLESAKEANEKGYGAGIGQTEELGWFVVYKHGETVFLRAAQTPESSPHIEKPGLFSMRSTYDE